jgi:hypothetical protein
MERPYISYRPRNTGVILMIRDYCREKKDDDYPRKLPRERGHSNEERVLSCHKGDHEPEYHIGDAGNTDTDPPRQLRKQY